MEMNSKKATLLLLGMLLSTRALAQNCNDHPVLEAYVHSRDYDAPYLDQLPADQKEVLTATYRTLESAVADYVSTKANNPVPMELVTNYSNFQKILQGDVLEGGLGIYSNVIGKLSPSLGEALPNMWRGAIDGLSGNGDGYGKREDTKNRQSANKALAKSGCMNMDLEPYDDTPDFPYYVGSDTWCTALNLESYKGPSEAWEQSVSPSCHVLGGKDNAEHDPTLPPDYYVNISAHIQTYGSDAEAASNFRQLFEELPSTPGTGGRQVKVFEYRGPDSHATGYFSAYLHRNAIVEIGTAAYPDGDSLRANHDSFADIAFSESVNPSMQE